MLLLDSLFVLAGITLLTAGAWLLVEAASSLAGRLGISPMWVGLTVVAIGTSAPELVVTVVAGMTGSTELAVSNVVGSNILNILMVLGVTAALAPIDVGSVTLRRNLGLVALASLGVWLLAADGLIGRPEGFLLLAFVPVFLWHVHRQEAKGSFPAPEVPAGFDRLPAPVLVGAVLLGVAALVGGGALAVDGAKGIVRELGVSERTIGLTVVAVGTSLPELATSLVAATRRKVDLAIGNLIGSNLLNLFLVLGAAAALQPAVVPAALWRIDMPVMIGAALLILRFSTTRNSVSRLEGGILLAAYAAYAAFIVIAA